MPTAFPRSTSIAAIAALAVVAIVWFAGIGSRTLIHPDEGRYAEIAREMAASGDWLTPRLNGLKYFEKPPLQYWLTAGAFDVLGVGNASARLPTVASTLVAAAFIGFVGWRAGGARLGITSAAALAGSAGYVVGGHVLALDGLLTATLAIALGAFVLAQHDDATPRRARAWMLVAWAAIAAATLTKGLIGIVIPGASLVLYTAATRDFAIWRRLSLGWGLLLFVALAAPWFVAVSKANPEFAHFFFIHEHFERYLTTEHKRVGAWWYFVPLLAVGVLPWLTILGWGLPRAWRDAAPSRNGFSWPRFALVWAAFVFVFFSVSSSKLPGYILPMFPPLALVTGWIVARADARTLARLVAPLVALGLLILAVLVLGWQPLARRFAYPAGIPHDVAAYVDWLVAAMIVSVAGGLATLAIWYRRAAVLAGVVVLGLSTVVSMQLALIGFDTMRTTRSGWDILQAARAAGDPLAADAPFYQVRMYDQTVPFYLGRTTTVVDFRDELALGLDAEPDKGIASIADWISRWNGASRAYALMPRKDFDGFVTQGVPMRELAHDARRVLVARR
jgi:4-amino-4-deoxy-L-arabinose transferase-like glycosyltransferase